jgi:heat shock protein HtpX
VLSIGLPLWAALGPAGRMALIGHELGHLINNDPRRRLLGQLALTTFLRLADIVDPRTALAHDEGMEWFAGRVLWLVYQPLFAVFSRIADALYARSMAENRAAEAYADRLALRLGGMDGVVELLRVSLHQRTVRRTTRGLTGRSGPAVSEWPRLVREALDAVPDDPASDLSVRHESDLEASHPPSGWRLRLVRTWPPAAPATPIPVELLAAADEALRRRYAAMRIVVANETV